VRRRRKRRRWRRGAWGGWGIWMNVEYFLLTSKNQPQHKNTLLTLINNSSSLKKRKS